MGNIAHLPQVSGFNDRELALIKRTVAADCNADEFDLFVSYCRGLQLDPRRRQIYAVVYNKDKPDKRKMSIIVGIDGFRAVAARTGCYRPDNEDPRYEYDDGLKGATNPLGLVKASVRLWQYSHGEWFAVAGTAFWDEFAPMKEEWAQGEDGKRHPTGKKTPEGKWSTMGRLMLAKCAESQALRKAWPDDFSNVYTPEEMSRADLELLPSEAAEKGAQTERMERIGAGKTILIDWMENEFAPLEPVPNGQLADRIMAFIEKHRDESSIVHLWRDRNRHGLREFWAACPSDALAIKAELEKAESVCEETNTE